MTPPSILAAGSAAAPRSAVQGWRELVRARREQMEAQLAAMGGPPEDWWAERSAQFARGIGRNAMAPPLGLAAIADRLDHGETLLDIGGGAGRYSVPLARVLRHVTLVEPSPAMAEAARTAFAAAGRDNFTVVEREWPGVRVPKASAVLIANVLSPIEDLEGFLKAALRRASGWLFIIHGSHDEGGPATARVVEAFHGEPRVPNPGLSELLPALHELGIFPDVTMSSRRFTRTFADLDEAARSIAATALVAPTPRALARIRLLLDGQLRRVRGGRLAAPAQALPVGLLTWRL